MSKKIEVVVYNGPLSQESTQYIHEQASEQITSHIVVQPPPEGWRDMLMTECHNIIHSMNLIHVEIQEFQVGLQTYSNLMWYNNSFCSNSNSVVNNENRLLGISLKLNPLLHPDMIAALADTETEFYSQSRLAVIKRSAILKFPIDK